MKAIVRGTAGENGKSQLVELDPEAMLLLFGTTSFSRDDAAPFRNVILNAAQNSELANDVRMIADLMWKHLLRPHACKEVSSQLESETFHLQRAA